VAQIARNLRIPAAYSARIFGRSFLSQKRKWKNFIVTGKSFLSSYRLIAPVAGHSTVTDFARLRGWSTSVPFTTAT
jgi:hypothetical protein